MSCLQTRIRQVLARTLLASPALLACTPALPQEREQGTLEEVLVTATRRTQSAQDIPISITALGADQLAQAGVVDTRDLAGLAPNLSTQGSFGRTAPSFFIRGIGNTQFNTNGNSKVGVYVDDVYLGSPAVHGAQLFDVERVEIARGPQGYLFGQNTTGGLVRSIVYKPKLGGGFTANADATYGRFSEVDLNAAVGFDLGERAALRVAASSRRDDGYQENDLLRADEGGADAIAGRVQLLFAPSDDVEILLNIHGSSDDGELAPYKQLGLVDPLTGGACARPALGSGCTDLAGYADTSDVHHGQWDVPNQISSVDASGASLTIDWHLDGATLTSVSAYEENDSEINEDTDASPLDIVHGSYSGSPEQFSQEVRFTSDSDGPTRWLAGLYYFTEDFAGSAHFAARGFGPGAFSGVGTTLEGVGQRSSMQTDSYAVFGNLDRDLSERWQLSLGLRYTHESKQVQYDAFLTDVTSVEPSAIVDRAQIQALQLFQTIDFDRKDDWDNVSGRVALSYRFAADALGYVSVARGFNSGNYNGGAFFDQTEASLVDPEILTSYEIGAKADLAGDTLRVNGDVYYYDFKDQQVFILASGAGGTPFQQLSNAAASTLYGAELETTWQPVRDLTLQLGVGYTHSRFDEFDSPLGGDLTGKRLPGAPEWNANLLAGYQWPLARGTLAITADAKYSAHQFFSVNNDPLLTQDAYWIGNARLSFAAPADRWGVALWVKNIADEDYFVGAFDLAGFGFDQLVVGAPRTYGLTLSVRW
jgi:iron complex outermembrane recepter protein